MSWPEIEPRSPRLLANSLLVIILMQSCYIVMKIMLILLFWSASGKLVVILDFKALNYSPSSELLYGCTTWALTKYLEKKIDENYTRILRATLNNLWKWHNTEAVLPYTFHHTHHTIKMKKICCNLPDKLLSKVLLWNPIHGHTSVSRPAKTQCRHCILSRRPTKSDGR